MKMTTEEAFVKVLQLHGIEHAFGIIGSAFMPISDLFPKAGITFWDVAHESNGGLICDGYTRSTGKIAMAIAQNIGTARCPKIWPAVQLPRHSIFPLAKCSASARISSSVLK